MHLKANRGFRLWLLFLTLIVFCSFQMMDVGMPHMIGGVMLFSLGLCYIALQCILTLFLKSKHEKSFSVRVLLLFICTSAFVYRILWNWTSCHFKLKFNTWRLEEPRTTRIYCKKWILKKTTSKLFPLHTETLSLFFFLWL